MGNDRDVSDRGDGDREVKNRTQEGFGMEIFRMSGMKGRSEKRRFLTTFGDTEGRMGWIKKNEKESKMMNFTKFDMNSKIKPYLAKTKLNRDLQIKNFLVRIHKRAKFGIKKNLINHKVIFNETEIRLK